MIGEGFVMVDRVARILIDAGLDEGLACEAAVMICSGDSVDKVQQSIVGRMHAREAAQEVHMAPAPQPGAEGTGVERTPGPAREERGVPEAPATPEGRLRLVG